jgi:hypothetical protein
MVPILSHMNPIRTFQIYFPKIHSNIIFPSKLGLTNGLFPFKFSQHVFTDGNS